VCPVADRSRHGTGFGAPWSSPRRETEQIFEVSALRTLRMSAYSLTS
jgi:hypothetical protein